MNAAAIVNLIAGSNLEPEINAVMELERAVEPPGQYPALEGLEITADGTHEWFGIDGAGGTYHVLSDGRILLVDSEGSAGVIAGTFHDFVATAVGLPGWRDALRFVGDADLEAARVEWLAYLGQWGLEAQLDEPWTFGLDAYTTRTPREARTAIMQYFNVVEPEDPFAMLHHAINTMNDDIAVSWNGNELRLFGR